MKSLLLGAVLLTFTSCTTAKIQDCPDEKIINRMPGPGSTVNEYYIYKGKRYELTDFDQEWLTTNCPYIKVQEVY